MMLRCILFIAAIAATSSATGAIAQSARDALGPTPYLPLPSEPPPRLTVDPPLPDALARGVAIVQYRVENLRILPVFGAGGSAVSPRAGHLHVTVDSLPWHWADSGGTNTIVVQGLPPGEHSLMIELADPQHHIYPGQVATVKLTVPALIAPAH